MLVSGIRIFEMYPVTLRRLSRTPRQSFLPDSLDNFSSLPVVCMSRRERAPLEPTHPRVPLSRMLVNPRLGGLTESPWAFGDPLIPSLLEPSRTVEELEGHLVPQGRPTTPKVTLKCAEAPRKVSAESPRSLPGWGDSGEAELTHGAALELGPPPPQVA